MPEDELPARAGRPGVAVVVPAKDEAARLGATLAACAELPDVTSLVVVDDGSTDSTSEIARRAGAVVVRHSTNLGKAAAMESGAAVVRLRDALAARPPSTLLFLDADLADSAAAATELLGPVRRGEADMTIATLPRQLSAGGGHGLVVRLAREGIRTATGWEPRQPLSGQRCLTGEAFQLLRPLAPGFGVETGLTIDALRAGLRVREVECALYHRVTGRDWRAQLHRGRQLRDVARALAARDVLLHTLPRAYR